MLTVIGAIAAVAVVGYIGHRIYKSRKRDANVQANPSGNRRDDM